MTAPVVRKDASPPSSTGASECSASMSVLKGLRKRGHASKPMNDAVFVPREKFGAPDPIDVLVWVFVR
jgi:hypothetical protein